MFPTLCVRLHLLDDLLKQPLSQHEAGVSTLRLFLPRSIHIGCLPIPVVALALYARRILPQPVGPFAAGTDGIKSIRFGRKLEDALDECFPALVRGRDGGLKEAETAERAVEVEVVVLHEGEQRPSKFRLVVLVDSAESQSLHKRPLAETSSMQIVGARGGRNLVHQPAVFYSANLLRNALHLFFNELGAVFAPFSNPVFGGIVGPARRHGFASQFVFGADER